MPIAPEELGRARRAWLEQQRHAHTLQNSAESAHVLAQAEWTCGNYLAALPRFLEARDRAPEVVEAQVSLVRALASLARWTEMDEALSLARQQHPSDPLLALATAQRSMRAGFGKALAVLAPVADAHPLCRLYADALTHLAEQREPSPRSFGDARLDALWAGFVWCYGQHGAGGFVGFPAQVLGTALAAAQVTGQVLECGVYFGRSLRLLADDAGHVVHGFDSFQGLPEAWNEQEPAGAYTTAGVVPVMPKNVQLHVGWFQDTLPPFFAANQSPIRLLHIDCDLYSSTRTVLAAAADSLVPGSVLVFDDFVGFPGASDHEFRAWQEFCQDRGVRSTVIASSLLTREVAIRVDMITASRSP